MPYERQILPRVSAIRSAGETQRAQAEGLGALAGLLGNLRTKHDERRAVKDAESAAENSLTRDAGGALKYEPVQEKEVGFLGLENEYKKRFNKEARQFNKAHEGAFIHATETDIGEGMDDIVAKGGKLKDVEAFYRQQITAYDKEVAPLVDKSTGARARTRINARYKNVVQRIRAAELARQEKFAEDVRETEVERLENEALGTAYVDGTADPEGVGAKTETAYLAQFAFDNSDILDAQLNIKPGAPEKFGMSPAKLERHISTLYQQQGQPVLLNRTTAALRYLFNNHPDPENTALVKSILARKHEGVRFGDEHAVVATDKTMDKLDDMVAALSAKRDAAMKKRGKGESGKSKKDVVLMKEQITRLGDAVQPASLDDIDSARNDLDSFPPSEWKEKGDLTLRARRLYVDAADGDGVLQEPEHVALMNAIDRRIAAAKAAKDEKRIKEQESLKSRIAKMHKEKMNARRNAPLEAARLEGRVAEVDDIRRLPETSAERADIVREDGSNPSKASLFYKNEGEAWNTLFRASAESQGMQETMLNDVLDGFADAKATPQMVRDSLDALGLPAGVAAYYSMRDDGIKRNGDIQGMLMRGINNYLAGDLFPNEIMGATKSEIEYDIEGALAEVQAPTAEIRVARKNLLSVLKSGAGGEHDDVDMDFLYPEHFQVGENSASWIFPPHGWDEDDFEDAAMRDIKEGRNGMQTKIDWGDGEESDETVGDVFADILTGERENYALSVLQARETPGGLGVGVVIYDTLTGEKLKNVSGRTAGWIWRRTKR